MHIPYLNTIRKDIFLETGIEVGVNIKEKDFTEWINSTKTIKEEIISSSDVIPNPDIVNDFVKKGYVHQGFNDCHLIAKMIYDINSEFEFYSGVVYRKNYANDSNVFFYHSFNVYKEKVYDFSLFYKDGRYLIDQNFCRIYYGVKIPNEVLQQPEKNGYLLDFYINH